MNTPNRFAPPRASLAVQRGVKAWFLRRPIPIFIIAAFCILQYIGILTELARNWTAYLGLIESNAVSPVVFFGKLVYPTLLFAAGTALLLLWSRTAVVLFAAYLAWGFARIVVATPTDYLSLALVFGFLVYSLRLASKGRGSQSAPVAPEQVL